MVGSVRGYDRLVNLPWWVWLLLVLAVIAGLFFVSIRQQRANVRTEFLAYLAEHHPEFEAREASASEIKVQTEDGSEGSLYLHNLYLEEARLEGQDEEGRRELFGRFAAVIAEGGQTLDLDPAVDRERLHPRIVKDDFPERAAAQAGPGRMPSLPLGPPGLSVVFVLDSEHSVAYLKEEQLADLELSPEEALELARSNLGPTFRCDVARRPLEDGSMTVLKSFDTYDAARLLLVPGCLEEGEALAALIPDRDTLVLAAVPADDDWSSLAKLARNNAGEPLWTRPLRVTSRGVFAVER